MTDHKKRERINELMAESEHWSNEDEALELAYSMINPTKQASALEHIATRMTQEER